MEWLIIWLVLSIPAGLLISAFMGFGDAVESDAELGPEMHDQTIVF